MGTGSDDFRGLPLFDPADGNHRPRGSCAKPRQTFESQVRQARPFGAAAVNRTDTYIMYRRAPKGFQFGHVVHRGTNQFPRAQQVGRRLRHTISLSQMYALGLQFKSQGGSIVDDKAMAALLCQPCHLGGLGEVLFPAEQLVAVLNGTRSCLPGHLRKLKMAMTLLHRGIGDDVQARNLQGWKPGNQGTVQGRMLKVQVPQQVFVAVAKIIDLFGVKHHQGNVIFKTLEGRDHPGEFADVELDGHI